MSTTSSAINFTIGAALGSSFTSVFGTAAQKTQMLGKALNQTNSKLRNVKSFRAATNALDRLKKLEEKGTISTERLGKAFDAVNKKIETSKKKMFKYGIGLKDLGKTQAALQKRQKIESMSYYGKKEASEGFGALKSGMFGAIGTAMAIGAPVRMAANFEQSMANVKAVTGATGESFTKLTGQARQLGRTTVFTADEAAQGMQYLGMAGFKTEQIMSSMPAVLDLAAAGSVDLGQAADISSNILTGFGLKAEDMSRVADVMAKTCADANTNMVELGEAMKYVAPVAAATNVSLEEAAAVVGTLSNNGMKATMAGTAMRKMLSSLASPTSAGAAVFDELGIATKDAEGNMRPLFEVFRELETATADMGNAEKAEAMEKIFGDRAMTGMLAILGKTGDLKNFTKELDKSAGSAKKMADIKLKTFNGQLKLLGSAASDVGITIGNALMPTLNSLMSGITSITSVVGKFAGEYPGLTKGLTMSVAGFFTVTKILPLVGNSFKGVYGSIKASIGTAQSAWLKSTEIIGKLRKGEYPKLMSTMKATGSVFSKTGSVMKNIAVGTIWPAMKTLFTSLLSGIRTVGMAFLTNPIGLVITGIAIGAALLIYYWEPVKNFFLGIFEAVGSGVMWLWNLFKQGFKWTPLGMIMQGWQPAIKWLTSKIEWIGKAWNKVKSWFGWGSDEEESIPQVGDTLNNQSESNPENILAENRAKELINKTAVNSNKTIQDNRKSEYKFEFNTQPGQNPEEFAEAVMNRIKQEEQKAARGALYDYSYA